MITFLSSPKGFSGRTRANQMAAIRSWGAVHPDAEVLLYGEALGSREAARSLGVKHMGAVASSSSGVPFFDAIAAHAATHGRFEVQVYLNCDILLTDHIIQTVETAHFPRYLITGQRIDLSADATAQLHMRDAASLVGIVSQDPTTTLHPPTGVDYFIFPRGLWLGLPPVVIGRAGYDAALLAFCLRRRIPVIDATLAMPALHQFHDYAHVAGAKGEVFSGIDAQNNRRLHDTRHSAPTVADATWRIIGGKLVRNHSRGDLLRRLEVFLRYRTRLKTASYGVRSIWRVLTAVGLYQLPRIELSEVLRSIWPDGAGSANESRKSLEEQTVKSLDSGLSSGNASF